jgi:hypothetical protein
VCSLSGGGLGDCLDLVGRTCCLFFDFWVCVHLSAFVCDMSMWTGSNGCAVRGGYAPLEVAWQWEVAKDLVFLFPYFFLTVLIDFFNSLFLKPCILFEFIMLH